MPGKLILAIAKHCVDFVDSRTDTEADFNIHVLTDFVELRRLMLEVSTCTG